MTEQKDAVDCYFYQDARHEEARRASILATHVVAYLLHACCYLLDSLILVCMHVGSQSDACIHPRSTPLLPAPHAGKARYSYNPMDVPGVDQTHRYELSEKASIVWLSVIRR